VPCREHQPAHMEAGRIMLATHHLHMIETSPTSHTHPRSHMHTPPPPHIHTTYPTYTHSYPTYTHTRPHTPAGVRARGWPRPRTSPASAAAPQWRHLCWWACSRSGASWSPPWHRHAWRHPGTRHRRQRSCSCWRGGRGSSSSSGGRWEVGGDEWWVMGNMAGTGTGSSNR
jgi:hypothetical protein